ncbi:MAG: hypothetical protein R2762_24800 [Bryobacteraceae bacterium]
MPAPSPQLQPDDAARWAVHSCPFTVEYSLQVLEELRVYGEEWFQKIPHGGMEVGAVLFGNYQDGVLYIREWRPIPCEHAKGPGFTLSEKDLMDLERLAEDWASAPELEAVVPVGWFHTHTRSPLFLSSDDSAIFDRYFPDPWAVSLVFCYAKNKPVTAGFFYRELDGSVRGEETAREFVVSPNPAMALLPKRKSSAPSRPRRPADAATGRAPRRDPGAQPTAETGTPADLQETPSAQGEAPQRPVREWQPISTLPDGEPRRSGLAWKIPLGIAALLAIGAFGWFATRPVAKVSAAVLRVEPYEDQLLVLWDRDVPGVREAERGVLVIRDGGSERTVPLDMLMARRGSVTYARSSGDVEIGLKLYKGSDEVFSELTRYVGKGGAPPAGEIAAAAPNPVQLEQKRDEVKKALAAQQERGNKLRQAKQRPRKKAKRTRR